MIEALAYVVIALAERGRDLGPGDCGGQQAAR